MLQIVVSVGRSPKTLARAQMPHLANSEVWRIWGSDTPPPSTVSPIVAGSASKPYPQQYSYCEHVIERFTNAGMRVLMVGGISYHFGFMAVRSGRHFTMMLPEDSVYLAEIRGAFEELPERAKAAFRHVYNTTDAPLIYKAMKTYDFLEVYGNLAVKPNLESPVVQYLKGLGGSLFNDVYADAGRFVVPRVGVDQVLHPSFFKQFGALLVSFLVLELSASIPVSMHTHPVSDRYNAICHPVTCCL